MGLFAFPGQRRGLACVSRPGHHPLSNLSPYEGVTASLLFTRA